jgi:hypothetical protein
MDFLLVENASRQACSTPPISLLCFLFLFSGAAAYRKIAQPWVFKQRSRLS